MQKMKPRYFDDLQRYPKANPIFITVDWASVRYIRRSGVCLLCEKSSMYYDFSFCYQREIWILYSHDVYFLRAMKLGQAIQQNAAKKILVMSIAV